MYYQLQGLALGTSYNIVFESDTDLNIHATMDGLVFDFEKSLSVYDPCSIISKINRNERVRVDKYFKAVFNRAKEIFEETNHLFDISAEPLFRAWGFSSDDKIKLYSAKIEKLRQHIGMDKISLDGDFVRKENPSIMLNANAIAKGYFADVIASYLEDNEVKNYLIEVGGEIRTSGLSPRGEAWTIGIDRPMDTNLIPGQDIQIVLQLTNKALATSGNYRQFYMKEGKKVSHTINPQTGYPVDHNLLSVTVVADTAMAADAYATAFLVAGIDESLDLLEQIGSDIEILFICDESGEFRVHYTEGFEEFILQ